jgi:hypothetical protein
VAVHTTVLIWVIIVGLAFYSAANLPAWWMDSTTYAPSAVAAIIALTLLFMVLSGHL